jgi:transcriptional regulator with XRE-family HTH domain
MKECSIDDEKIIEIYKRIGKNVAKFRKEKGITQLALSLAINHKSVGTISMSEINHKNKHFNIEHLIKIAEVLEVDICKFFK